MPAPIVESSVREGEEPVKLPPTVAINRMSDKFKEMLAKGEPLPAAIADKSPVPADKPHDKPSENPPEKQTAPPARTDKPPDKEPKIPREHFKALETQRDEFKTKWEAAEAKAKEQEARVKETEAKIPTDYEQIKSKLSEADEIRKRFYVETDPIFKQAFDQKIAAGIDEIKDVAGSKAEELIELITLPSSAKRDAAIMELTEDMPQFKQFAISRAMQDVRKLQKDRAAELAKPSENYKHLEDVKSQRASQEKLAHMDALERAVRIRASEASKETVHFQKLEGNEEHNQRVAENENMLREFTTSDMGPEERAKLSAWAVRGIRAAQTDVLKDALIQKLQGELKAIQDANPSAQGRGKPMDKGKPLTAAQKYHKAMTEGIPEE